MRFLVQATGLRAQFETKIEEADKLEEISNSISAKKEAARLIIPLGKPNNPGGISVGPPCLATGRT